jgi:hypothetical protein
MLPSALKKKNVTWHLCSQRNKVQKIEHLYPPHLLKNPPTEGGWQQGGGASVNSLKLVLSAFSVHTKYRKMGKVFSEKHLTLKQMQP